MNETVKRLETAKHLIDNPDNWCQREYRKGNKMCATAALSWVMYRGDPYMFAIDPSRAADMLREAAEEIGRSIFKLPDLSPMYINDRTDHETVMRMFDLAIEKAKHSISMENEAENGNET